MIVVVLLLETLLMGMGMFVLLTAVPVFVLVFGVRMVMTGVCMAVSLVAVLMLMLMQALVTVLGVHDPPAGACCTAHCSAGWLERYAVGP